MVTKCHVIETAILNEGRWQVTESKCFAWVIASAWNTYLAWKGRRRTVLHKNTEISESSRSEIVADYSKLRIQAHGPFLHGVSQMFIGY